MASINTNSTVGMGLIIAIICGIWGLYTFVSPTFAKVGTNNIMLNSHKERIERIEKSQDTYHEHIISISNDISEIKGAIKSTNK